MTRSLLSALLAVGLLGSGHACSWLCRSAASPEAAADSHCGSGATPAPERDSEPQSDSHEGCSSCALVAAASTSPGSQGDAPALALAATPHPASDFVRLATASLAFSDPVLRAPPRDVLAITSSLRL